MYYAKLWKNKTSLLGNIAPESWILIYLKWNIYDIILKVFMIYFYEL